MRPGRGLAGLLAVWMILGLVAAALDALRPAWFAAGAVLFAVAAAEWWRLQRLPAPAVERDAPPALALGVGAAVELRLRNRAPRRLVLEVSDRHPRDAVASTLPQRLVLPAAAAASDGDGAAGRGAAEGDWQGGQGDGDGNRSVSVSVSVRYELRPLRRGNQRFGEADLLMRSPGDLWRRRVAAGTPQAVRVLPNFQTVARYALLAEEDWLSRIGVRVNPRRGEGSEFRELREYRSGDSLRRIDWKATSRRRKLISRAYQEERDQQIVFLADCSRRMRARDGELSHFDHMLNTVLLLAYVALRQGDAVGFLSFGGDRRWLAPVKGAAGLGALVQRVYDLEPSLQISDYAEAATALLMRQRRRALVVLLSNLRDEDSDEILPALRQLRTRNVVLVASLREAALGAARNEVPADLPAALRLASVERYLAARAKVFDRLRAGGAHALDVEPAELPRQIVQAYLRIKRSGAL